MTIPTIVEKFFEKQGITVFRFIEKFDSVNRYAVRMANQLPGSGRDHISARARQENPQMGKEFNNVVLHCEDEGRVVIQFAG